MFMDQPTKNNVTFQMYYVCRSKLETAEAALVKEHQIFNRHVCSKNTHKDLV